MADAPTDPKPATGDDKDDLGDAGKKALDEERKARREADRQLAAIRTELEELKGKDKPEIERLTEQLATAKADAKTANENVLRFEVAAAKGVKARWLSGSTREELEAAADEYLADHPPATGGSGTPTPTKPTEDLKGGGDPTSNDTEPNIDDIVKKIPRL